MKKFFKRFLFSLGIVFAVGVLSSCTKSFCNVQDQAEMISIYAKNNIESINTTAQNNGILIPQEDFNTFIDNKVQEYLNSDICPVDNEGNKIESFARYAGYNKDGQAELFYNYNTWVEEAKNEIGVNNVPGKSYITYYQSSLTRGKQSSTACITPTSGYFGFEGNERYVSGKTWGQAFTDYGFLEGLFVYPIACMLHYFTLTFGTSGWGQVAAILLVTIIIRSVVLLITFPITLSQTRMSELQPKIAALQQKYPNIDTNVEDKQRFAQEQMKLYKENKVHPFLQIVLMIPQFIIFICVWSALQGSAILTQGTVFNLQLTTTTWNAIRSFSQETPFAIVLFLLMVIGQICSTMTPQWINKWKEKNLVTRTVKVQESSQQKTMKYVSIFMLIFIIFMGISLPAAMTIYWIVGSMFTLAQTLILEFYQKHKRHKNGIGTANGPSWNRNKKVKKDARFSVRRG